jgi:DNA-binding LacI/PurR family transcriptional regulator
MAIAQKPDSESAPKQVAASSLKTTRRTVQMTDIAHMAGVSASTVSRALSGSALIPEATRQRISEIARSLNYRVNVGAANLRKRDVHTIGVAILGDSMQSISDPFLLSILGTVADALDERGMSLMLTRLRESSQGSLTAMLDSGQVAGLIIIGQLTWHEHLNALAKEGFPIAVWGACLPDAAYPVVGGDNVLGGLLATQHLIAQGCRRIAFFGDTSHPEAGMRYQGYLQAMQEVGIVPDPRLVQPFLFGYVRIRETIDQWLDQNLTFDAIFATSDVTAISILGALTERGISVPSQVKLVGYDDIALAAHVHPSLTSVRQPPDLAGRALVDLLFDVLQGKERRTVTLPATLIARDSSL